ncbi:uncharacterized protein ACRADG_002805 [Cochliomyia hominivorax]
MMVVSKRCKICTVIEADNIPISGEYFGKLLPDLILNISGLELDPRKANGVLICQSCAIQLVHTGTIVDKLRSTLQRLKKLETKSRTPSKNTSKAVERKDGIIIDNMEPQNLGTDGIVSQINQDESKHGNDMVITKPQKKIIRRKSAFSSVQQINTDENEEVKKRDSINSDNLESVELDIKKHTKDVKISNNTKTTAKKIIRRKSLLPDKQIIGNNEETPSSKDNGSGDIIKELILNETKSQNDIKARTPIKIVRRKSVNPNENDIQKNDNTIKRINKMKTPNSNKTVKEKNVLPDERLNEHVDEQQNLRDDELESLELQSNTMLSSSMKILNQKAVAEENKNNNSEVNKQDKLTPRFKKILDPDAETPLKKSGTITAKRKIVTTAEKSTNSSTNSTPIKRIKTILTTEKEQSPMKLNMDKHDSNEVKVMNCIICGKAFNQKSALREHIETRHMGETLKACPHCSSEFRSQQKYESHVFSEKCKNANHPCQYPKCNKRFKSVHKMELHMQEKHLSQDEQEME